MLDADSFGNSLLELTDERTVIRQPPPVQYAGDSRQETVPIADVRPAHVERLGKRRFATQDR
jgi:hypothetical protein